MLKRQLLWVLALLSSCVISCNTAPPTFIEISAPRGTIDALGPYAFSAKLSGAVDQVNVRWVRITPESEIQAVTERDFIRSERLRLVKTGETWSAELAGGVRVATYYYYFEAIGSGGRTQEPLGGVDSFEVNTLSNTCIGDSDCLSGEVCHRREYYCFTPPEPCTDHAHCPRDRDCNFDSGLCRFSDSICTDNSDCESGRLCLEGICTPDIVDPPLSCDPPCEAEGSLCQEGRCVSIMNPCTADGQCDSGFACDLQTGLCELGERGVFCRPCQFDEEVINADCGVGFDCRIGVSGCRPKCGNRGPNQPECGLGERCEDGICIHQEFLGCAAEQCVRNAECTSGRCDRGRCTEVQSCIEDDDCLGGICIDQQCRIDNQCDWISCDAGTLCLGGRCTEISNERSTCARCRLDTDCLSLSHCVYPSGEELGFCYTLCETDAQCQAEESCYFSQSRSGYCGPNQSFACDEISTSCDLDELEPNDTLNQSAVLMLPSSGRLTLEGVNLCSLDDDFYHVVVSPGMTYQARILTEAPSQFYLYDEQGQLIGDLPNVFPIPEGISFEVNQSMYLQVQGVAEVSASYSIQFTTEQPMVVCANDDSLEDNDVIEESYPVGAGADLTLSLCPRDEDWFTIRGRTGELWRVNLFLSEFMGEVELSIGTRQAFLENAALSWFYNSDGEQTAEYMLQENEPYYLRLRCLNCTDQFRYQLGLSR